MNNSKKKRIALLVWVSLAGWGLVLWLSPPLMAQSHPGRLSGTVKDEKGTAIPGATIRATHGESGKKFETYSNDDGRFLFESLPGGTYRLDAEMVLLPKAAQDGIQVVSLQEANVELVLGKMLLKSPSDEIKKELPASPSSRGSTPQIPKGARSNTPRLVQEFQNLTLLNNPGLADVTPSAPPATSELTALTTGGEIGNQNVAENFLINGSVNTGAFQLTQPGPGEFGDSERLERVREFMRNADPAMLDRIQQFAGPGGFGGLGGGPALGGPPGPRGGAGGPRFGGGGGAFRGFGGRSARANKIQGNLFFNYRNSIFDAKPYSFQGVEQSRPAYIRNHGGASLGGPLNIPHIYKSKDRTSFFVSWQSQRNKNPFSATTTVPTLEQRQGDFSQTYYTTGPLAGQRISLYDPQSGFQNRQTFPDNRIPASRFDAAALGLMRFIPLPNLPSPILNFHFEQSLPDANDTVSGRLEHKFSAKDSLASNYTFRRSETVSSQVYPELFGRTRTRSQNFTLAYTHTFNDHFIHEVRYQFNRSRVSVLNDFAFEDDIAGALGITGTSRQAINYGPPTLSFTNFGALNLANPALNRDQTSHFADNVTYVRAQHNLRMGWEYRRIQMNRRNETNGRGTFVFSGFSTAALDAQGNALDGSGFDFADFLLGLPQSSSRRFDGSNVYFRSQVYAAYLQDNWRLKPRLTLNLGLRYELFTPLTEKFDHIANLDIAPDFTGAAVVLPGQAGPYSGVFPRALMDGDYNNFSPRVGFAFRPFPKKRTVVRGSYSIFFVPSIYNQFYPQLASQPPFATTSQLLTSPQRILTLENGFPTDPVPGVDVRNTFAVDRHYRVGYAQQWNLSFQHELRRNWVVEVGYLGTKGTKLDLLRSPNRAAPGSSLTTQERLRIGNAQGFRYDTSGALSIFHAAQLRVQRRMSRGLAWQGLYVFSKSIDDASSLGGGGGGTVVQDENNLRAERALSSFDARHRLTLNGVYEFPFGERKRWLNHRGSLARVLGDWQISGNALLQSGNFFTPRLLGSGSNNSGTGASQSERPDYNGQPITLPSDQRTTEHYFNTQAFVPPPPGQFGNAGRNIIEGPGLVNVNLAANKTIPLKWEGKRVEFRTQIQNLLNHPNFTGLNTTIDSTNFGRLTGTRGLRTVEFDLRIRF